jgi:RNA polymerase sigma factor (sigma-70 family)
VEVGAGTLARFREGDADAVRELYRAYGGLVYAVAHRALGSPTLADEATQQTFLQAWRAAAGFDVSRDPGPWLATIARRVAIDVYRREHPHEHQAVDEARGVAVPDDTERAQDAWEVRAAVDALPPEERDVVRLQHLDGLTHADIAARLEIPLGTVKSRSNRAHRRLAAALGHLRENGP